MGTEDMTNDVDPEINAIRIVHETLKQIEVEAQIRVIQYVTDKLGIRKAFAQSTSGQRSDAASTGEQVVGEPDRAAASDAPPTNSSDGISPVAQKWMTRNGLDPRRLGSVFSLGGEEIDLIADSVPGKSKRKKMRSVILLKGVAAYLGSGVARITHQQIKETCVHYDAYDSPNFAKHLKDLTSEISGTKQSGYTLTPRGLNTASKLVKQMMAGEQS